MNNIVEFDFREITSVPMPASVRRRNAAIDSMCDGLEKNREAVADFQKTIGVLDQKMKTLEITCEKYLRKLADIKVRRLGRRATRLASIMDDWMEK